MNIVFLYAGAIIPEKGGVQRVTSVLSDYFESKDYNIFYLSLTKGGDNIKYSKRQFFLPYSDNLWMNSEYYIEFLRINKIDIVINQFGISPTFSKFSFQANLINVKVISVIHNSLLSGIKNFSSFYSSRAKKLNIEFILRLTENKLINKFLLNLYKLKYRKHYRNLCLFSDKVVLLSSKYIGELSFMVDDDAKLLQKVTAIANPVSFHSKFIDFNTKKKELLYVGRIETVNKRVDLLLDIWSRLYMQFPEWELKIVGGGIETEALINLSNKMGLKRISFEGFQDPKSFYKNASIFCMTSSAEGFGMVLVEAMQYGTVPFAFNSYLSVTDIIDNNKNGILVKPFDCAEYASKLASLIRNKTDLEYMSKEAYVKSKKFEIEKIGNLWFDLFNKMHNKHK